MESNVSITNLNKEIVSRFLPQRTQISNKGTYGNVLNIAGDIGRLGGLFKHWLVRNEDNKANFSNKRTYNDIDEIVDQILDLQILLKEQAKRIIQNDNQKDSKQKAE